MRRVTRTGERAVPLPAVLLDHGEYWVLNKGDLAILQVTVTRLLERWPRASIGVLTRRPPTMRLHSPGVLPIDPSRGGDWPRRRPQLLRRLWPASLQDASLPVLAVVGTTTLLFRRAARAAYRVGRRTGGAEAARSPTTHEDAQPEHGTVPAAVRSADLVVAMGGGYMTDVDPAQVSRTLDLLEAAIRRGTPTAMLGQGLGPLRDPRLRERARQVLPLVDLIACRESRRGPALLESLGVAAGRVVVTGDDAVELAYRVRRQQLGTGLGLCLRVADYSPVDAEAREALVGPVQRAAHRLGAHLLPLSISEHRAEDRRATAPLLHGYPEVRRPLSAHASPRRLASRVGTCRVVVTGAYHLAVFALSQGIPVVALSSTEYYDDKFLGLAGCFGAGVTLVRLDPHEITALLESTIVSAWADAPAGRAGLLAAAERQVRDSRAALARACALVGPGS